MMIKKTHNSIVWCNPNAGKPDDSTKPSRINRRRKKRWKIADLMPEFLTEAASCSNLVSSISRLTGIGTPFRYGVKTPLPLVAFLCSPFSAAFCRLHSVMAGLFGHPLRMAAPYRGSSNQLKPVAQSLEPLRGGYSSLDMESPL